MKKSVMLIKVLLFAIILVSCQKTNTEIIEQTVDKYKAMDLQKLSYDFDIKGQATQGEYVNIELGYKLIFPEEWKEYVIVNENNDTGEVDLCFYSKDYNGKYGYEKYGIRGVPFQTIGSKNNYYFQNGASIIDSSGKIGEAKGIDYYSYSGTGVPSILGSDNETTLEKEMREKYQAEFLEIIRSSEVKFEELDYYDENGNDYNNSLIYTNEILGYQIQFPELFRGYYNIVETDNNCINVYFLGKSYYLLNNYGELKDEYTPLGIKLFEIIPESFIDNVEDYILIGNSKGINYFAKLYIDYDFLYIDPYKFASENYENNQLGYSLVKEDGSFFRVEDIYKFKEMINLIYECELQFLEIN